MVCGYLFIYATQGRLIMNLLKDKRFYLFLIPSLIGAFLFVTPIQHDGNLTITIAIIANFMLNCLESSILTIIWLLISVSTILTVVHKLHPIGFLKQNQKMDSLFSVSGFWLIVRVIGFLFAKYVLKLSLLNNLGSITGGMTSTPALGTLINVAGTEDVAAAYAATYPVALIAIVLVSQFLIILF